MAIPSTTAYVSVFGSDWQAATASPAASGRSVDSLSLSGSQMVWRQGSVASLGRVYLLPGNKTQRGNQKQLGVVTLSGPG